MDIYLNSYFNIRYIDKYKNNYLINFYKRYTYIIYDMNCMQMYINININIYIYIYIYIYINK